MSTSTSGNGSGVWSPPDGTPAPIAAAANIVSERPEALVGAAFVGGIALALIVRRLGR
ncbi:MAG: hypothetical protein ACR2ND_16150 [Solirubrobacteraceae bacterium]